MKIDRFFILSLAIFLTLFLGCKAKRRSVNSDVKIVGGESVKNTEFTEVVAIAVRADDDPKVFIPFCTGTLIAKEVILTAAHCLDIIPRKDDKPILENYRVLYGTSWKTETKPTYMTIRDLVWHKDFDRSKEMVADIGLLFFDASPKVSPSPAPLFTSTTCLQRFLAKAKADENDILTLVGFGHTSNIGNSPFGEKRSVVTRVAARNVASNFADYILIGESGKGTAKGDSGGPAFLTLGGKVFQFGVISSADFYGEKETKQINNFSAETRVKLVPNYIDWIIESAKASIPKQSYLECNQAVEALP